MADQMTCLGFTFNSEEDLQRFFSDHWEKKAVIDMARGVYLRLDVAEGIQCWLSVDPENHEVLDWDMHYAHAVQQGCCFDADLGMDEAGQSGYIRVLLKPGTDDELPLTVAAPALAYWPDREPGSPGLVSPAFYALNVDASDGIECLTADPDDDHAVLCGRVATAERCRNAWSGKDFWHLTVSCRGMTLDLLCAEEAFAQIPSTGTMLRAECTVTALCESGIIA